MSEFGTFFLSPNGSILYKRTQRIGSNKLLPYQEMMQSDKSFRINYRAKDGADRSKIVNAETLDEAKSKISDLDYVNYHIED